MRRFFSGFIVLFLMTGLLVEAVAQSPARVRPIYRGESTPDPAEGARILQEFRNLRPQGDYVFDFTLQYLPRRGSSVHYFGQMLGTWSQGGPLTRINVLTRSEDDREVNLLLQSGHQPFVWLNEEPLAVESSGEHSRLLAGQELISPIIDGLTFTPLEMQSQFIYWEDYVYEGRDTSGRTLHVYLMQPPASLVEELPDVGAVRIFIDQQFGAMTKAEVLDPAGAILRSFRVLAFARVDDQYIVRTIDLIDEQTRDKTRFEVMAAAMGRDLDERLFQPENLAVVPDLEGVTLQRIR